MQDITNKILVRLLDRIFFLILIKISNQFLVRSIFLDRTLLRKSYPVLNRILTNVLIKILTRSSKNTIQYLTNTTIIFLPTS